MPPPDQTGPTCSPKEDLPLLSVPSWSHGERVSRVDPADEEAFRELGTEPPPPTTLFVKGEGEPNAAHASDPVQKGHMDCFLIAAMSALVKAHPDPDRWLSEMIKPQPDGSFNVTFHAWSPGEPWNGIPAGIHPKTVNVSPADFRHAAESDDDNEIWPAVVEKAYSVAFPDKGTDDAYGFDGGRPGQAMELMTGVAGLALKPTETTIATLADYQRQGHAMTVTTHGKTLMGLPAPPADRMPEYAQGGLIFFSRSEELNDNNNRIRPHHVYTVGKVDTEAGTVTVHNVWDMGRQDIVLPYDRFQVLFSNVDANPVHPRRPR
jgi:calpain family cysteine protease